MGEPSHLRLNAEGEAAWFRLKTHLAWCEGFALVYLFSDQPGVVEIFRERLADINRARVTRLRQYEPKESSNLIPGLLLRLLEPSPGDLALNAPLWADLSVHGGGDWRQARLELLARVNEQRERLRLRQPRPVVLILPAAERSAAIAIAPDLWSIRQFSLTTGPWLVPAEARAETARPPCPNPSPSAPWKNPRRRSGVGFRPRGQTTPVPFGQAGQPGLGSLANATWRRRMQSRPRAFP